MLTKQKIDLLFAHHPPKDDQLSRYERVRNEARSLAHTILETAPPGEDRQAAIRALRKAVMFTNAAIACGETE